MVYPHEVYPLMENRTFDNGYTRGIDWIGECFRKNNREPYRKRREDVTSRNDRNFRYARKRLSRVII